jgi:hypothetical protein
MKHLICCALTLALGVVSASAQTPTGNQPRQGENPGNTADYYNRYGDEVRAKQAVESAHIALHTPRFSAALRGTEPGEVNLNVTWDSFATAGGKSFVAIQLGLPPTLAKPGAKVVMFGELKDAKGVSVADFEDPAVVLESKGDAFLERTLFVKGDASAATFGVAIDGKVAGLGRVTMDGDTGPDPSHGVSRLIVSSDVHNLSQQQSPFEPFAFGGTKVIPKPDRTFRASDEVWLFEEVRNPALGDDKAPRLSMHVAISGNGKQIETPWQTADASPLKGVSGHYGVGTTVDVSALKPGEYKVKLALRDAAAKQSYEREQTIKIRE